MRTCVVERECADTINSLFLFNRNHISRGRHSLVSQQLLVSDNSPWLLLGFFDLCPLHRFLLLQWLIVRMRKGIMISKNFLENIGCDISESLSSSFLLGLLLVMTFATRNMDSVKVNLAVEFISSLINTSKASSELLKTLTQSRN